MATAPSTGGHPILSVVTAGTLSTEHRQHLLDELGEEGLELALQAGARSLDAKEALAHGFRFGSHRTGGLWLPFGGSFAQLRCDDPPIARNGDPVKYLNRGKVKQTPVTFGADDATLATEGWKDALRLHLDTGETVQGIAGVTGHRLLSPTVTKLIYDADAGRNHAVWSQLITAGLQRRTLRVGFFPADIAGPKGGACEFFREGGDFETIIWHKARQLLEELPKGWDRTLRTAWQPHALRHLARLALKAGHGRDAAVQLVAGAAKIIAFPVDRARQILALERRKVAPPPKHLPPDAPASIQLVAAAGMPTDWAVNAGAWCDALSAGIGSRLCRNLLSQQIELDGQVLKGESEELLYVQAQQAGWKIKKPDCYDGTRAVALQNSYHPVREYLDRVADDPEIKAIDLDTVAARYIGITDQLSAAMLRCLLIGAVARIHQPGCTAPGVVVLHGDQGTGKTDFWKALAGAFYVVSTDHEHESAKDRTMAMHSAWFYDLDEIDKVTTVKQAAPLRSLITTTADTLRLPYARLNETFPRQFVIVGAANGDGFLVDPEGNRRYWVLDCPQKKDTGQYIDGPGASRDRDAIWKAAVIAYRSGAAWALSTSEQAASNVRNGQWEAVDEWVSPLAAWAEKTVTPGGFTTREAINGAGLRLQESITKSDEMRAADALRRAGFQRQHNATHRSDGRRDRFWQVAQPAQAATTCPTEVVPAEVVSPATDLSSFAQPVQPFEEVFKGDVGEVPIDRGDEPPSMSLPRKEEVVLGVPVVSAAETDSGATELSRHNIAAQPRHKPRGCAMATQFPTTAPLPPDPWRDDFPPEQPVAAHAGIRTVTELVSQALEALRLAPGPLAVDPVLKYLQQQFGSGAPSRAQVAKAMTKLVDAEPGVQMDLLEVDP